MKDPAAQASRATGFFRKLATDEVHERDNCASQLAKIAKEHPTFEVVTDAEAELLKVLRDTDASFTPTTLRMRLAGVNTGHSAAGDVWGERGGSTRAGGTRTGTRSTTAGGSMAGRIVTKHSTDEQGILDLGFRARLLGVTLTQEGRPYTGPPLEVMVMFRGMPLRVGQWFEGTIQLFVPNVARGGLDLTFDCPIVEVERQAAPPSWINTAARVANAVGAAVGEGVGDAFVESVTGKKKRRRKRLTR